MRLLFDFAFPVHETTFSYRDEEGEEITGFEISAHDHNRDFLDSDPRLRLVARLINHRSLSHKKTRAHRSISVRGDVERHTRRIFPQAEQQVTITSK